MRATRCTTRGAAATLAWVARVAVARRCSVTLVSQSESGNVRLHAVFDEQGGTTTMSKILRGLAAGYGAKKLGGGCFSTVLVFLLLWWLLGNFGVFE